MQKRKSSKSSYELHYAFANFLLANSSKFTMPYSYYYKANVCYLIGPNYSTYCKQCVYL